MGLLLEFPCGRLGTNSFWHPLGFLLIFAIPGDSFFGIPPCFPLLGFTLIFLFARNSVFSRRGFTVILLSWGTPSIEVFTWYDFMTYSIVLLMSIYERVF